MAEWWEKFKVVFPGELSVHKFIKNLSVGKWNVFFFVKDDDAER
jgi:hypothetical protein